MMTEGKLIAPNGAEIEGTLDIIYGVALMGMARGIGDNGIVDFDYCDETRVLWDTQETVKRVPPGGGNPRRVFVDESGAQWTEDQLTFIPPSDDEEPEPEQPSDLTLVCELAERFLNEGEPLSSSERAAAAAALERLEAAGPDSDALFVAVD